VLQRIGLCYLIVSIIYFTLPLVFQWVVIAGFGAIYLGFMHGFNVPNCGKNNLTPNCNAGGYIDRLIFGPNWMAYPNDPEGLLSTLTSCITTYCGLMFGVILINFKRNMRKIVLLWSLLGSCLIVASVILQFWLPYNKRIWSFSFALVTAGIDGLILVICYVCVDLFMWRGSIAIQTAIKPFIWIGTNPLFIFVAMIFLEIILLDTVHVTLNGNKASLWAWLFAKGFSSWIPDPYFASLIFSLVHLILWEIVGFIMYKRKWFVKI